MINKRNIVGLTTIVAVILFSLYIISNKNVEEILSEDRSNYNGNNNESIKEVIKTYDTYKDKKIRVIESEIFDEIKLTGFLYNNKPAYIRFEKNEQGDFKPTTIQGTNKNFLFTSTDLTKNQNPIFIFVTNSKNNIAEIKFKANGQKLEKNIQPFKVDFTWTILPDTNKESYRFESFKYFDENGDQIKDQNS